MKNLKINLFFIILLFALSCKQDDYTPLPKSYLRIDFPEKAFTNHSGDCPFSFEIPNYSIVVNKFKHLPPCYKTVYFPDFKAEILYSYHKIDTSVFSLIEQIRSNVDAHNFRARGVIENAWIDNENKVYGNTFEITGDVACNYIFYLTDSNNHFFSGELLFLTKPNYDSLQPVLEFIQSDIKHLIETFKWENSSIIQKQESL